MEGFAVKMSRNRKSDSNDGDLMNEKWHLGDEAERNRDETNIWALACVLSLGYSDLQ